jgi:hypothetical protein
VSCASQTKSQTGKAVWEAEKLLEANSVDLSHISFEERKMISRTVREVGPELVTDEDLV